jgi:hypothetical protein
MKTEHILIGAAVVGGIILLTKGKVGNYVGQSAGSVTGGSVAGFTEGFIESTLVDPYNWAYNYPGYIPIIDEGAKAGAWLKGLGDPNKWWS